MKVLLDTNIVHREAGSVVNPDIGILFKWLDDLHYQKCVHPVTVEEINKHGDPKTVTTFKIKLSNYQLREFDILSPELQNYTRVTETGR